MGFLRRVHAVTLRDKLRSCEIRKALNLVPLWLRFFGHVTTLPQKRPARQSLLAPSTGEQPRSRPRTRWRDYISDLAWARLGVEPAEIKPFAASATSPKKKRETNKKHSSSNFNNF